MVHQLSSILYISLFVVRRLIICAAILLLTSYPWAQTIIFNVLALLQIAYLTSKRPFIDPGVNRLEIFNELCILGVGICFMTFTDFNQDPFSRYNVGYAGVGIICLNSLVNMTLAFYGLLCSLKEFVSLILEKCRGKKVTNQEEKSDMEKALPEPKEEVLNQLESVDYDNEADQSSEASPGYSSQRTSLVP